VKPKAVLAYCREKGIKAFDLRFVDVSGDWRHISFPISALTEASFEEGFGHEIVLDESAEEAPKHAILVPQGGANYLDPFTPQPTLVLIANVQDAIMREESPLDSRYVAMTAMRYLESSTIGDGVAVKASCQFRTFRPERSEGLDEVQPIVSTLLACGPADRDFRLRCEVAETATEAGVHIERHFSGIRSSSELVLKPTPLVECCDDLFMLRYLLGQNAWNHHEKISAKELWLPSQWAITRQGESIFVGSSYRGLSEAGLHAMGGVVKHADVITAVAIANDASIQSVPWLRLCSSNAVESICRVAITSNNPRDRAIEFRGAPAGCNAYLVYSAVLMAMIDGIQNKTSPGAALEKQIDGASDSIAYTIGMDASGDSGRVQLMEKLMAGSDFLSRGEVFSDELIDSLCRQLGNAH
jgi:glutamine synthetase